MSEVRRRRGRLMTMQVTPQALANFSPGFERSENPGIESENLKEP